MSGRQNAQRKPRQVSSKSEHRGEFDDAPPIDVAFSPAEPELDLASWFKAPVSRASALVATLVAVMLGAGAGMMVTARDTDPDVATRLASVSQRLDRAEAQLLDAAASQTQTAAALVSQTTTLQTQIDVNEAAIAALPAPNAAPNAALDAERAVKVDQALTHALLALDTATRMASAHDDTRAQLADLRAQLEAQDAALTTPAALTTLAMTDTDTPTPVDAPLPTTTALDGALWTALEDVIAQIEAAQINQPSPERFDQRFFSVLAGRPPARSTRTDPVAAVTSLRAAADQQNLDDVLRALDALPAPARAIAEPWIAQATTQASHSPIDPPSLDTPTGHAGAP